MSELYDICVDYEVLCELQYKLELIGHNLRTSTAQMTYAIKTSKGFLVGMQFDKANKITLECISLVKNTENNIMHARGYLEKLKEVLEEYNKCAYSGEFV